jgi:hypothetical protein
MRLVPVQRMLNGFPTAGRQMTQVRRIGILIDLIMAVP